MLLGRSKSDAEARQDDDAGQPLAPARPPGKARWAAPHLVCLGALRDLTPEQAADLLEFLASLK